MTIDQPEYVCGREQSVLRHSSFIITYPAPGRGLLNRVAVADSNPGAFLIRNPPDSASNSPEYRSNGQLRMIRDYVE